MKSLNIVFPEKGKIKVINEYVGPLKANEVLCSTSKSLIGIGTELFCLRGIFDSGTNWKEMVKYPFYPGTGVSAEIIKTGKNVKDFEVGDRVGLPGGAHKQYFKVDINKLHKIPDEISSKEATFASLAVTTQLGIRKANIELGESVGVIGVGVMGQLVIQYLKIQGAREIIAIDKSLERLKVAKRYGATITISEDLKKISKKVMDITSGCMLDVVFDLTGDFKVLSSSIKLLRKLGKIILLGDTPTPNKQFLGPGTVSNGITIIGVHGFIYPEEYSIFTPWTHKRMIELFYDFILQRKMSIKDLITRHVSPINIETIYNELILNRYKDIAIIIDWNQLKSK